MKLIIEQPTPREPHRVLWLTDSQGNQWASVYGDTTEEARDRARRLVAALEVAELYTLDLEKAMRKLS